PYDSVQVEFARRCKIGEHGYKQKLPTIKDKENLDSYIISS
ncbi:1356_t:CDS:1, partial [Racocetra persica]